MNKSYLLINEPPLVVSPRLACVIGLNEALIVQQLHYWLNNPKSEGRIDEEGNKWIYNTYEEWQENFPFWSTDKIQRIFLKLEELGVVIARQLDAKKRDMRKFYRIDYDKLCAMDDAILRPSNAAKLHDVNNESETTIDYTYNDEKQKTQAPHKRGDLVDGLIELSRAPGVKREARIDAILSYLAKEFHLNTETKQWREFARFVDSEQQAKGWNVEVFVAWLKAQRNFDISFWTPRRMMEHYPRAFERRTDEERPQYGNRTIPTLERDL